MSNRPLLIAGVLAVLFVVLLAFLVAGVIFWMMLGSPWPIDPSAFVE